MHRRRRLLISLVLSLGAFLVASSWIRSAVPWSKGDGLQAKLADFAAQKDEIDAVYIGSSYVFHSFRPEVIDPIVSRPERPFRSYNLGMAGMFSFEADALLRAVLDLRPARLRWAVIGAPTWRPKLSKAGENELTERNARWHSPEATALALYSVALSGASREERLRLALTHLRLFGLWLGNHGRGPAIWRHLAQPESPEVRAQRADFRARAGYQPLEARGEEVYRVRQRYFMTHTQEYLERLAEIRAEPARRDTGLSQLRRYNRAALKRQLRAVDRAGVEPIYVLLPAFGIGPYFGELADRGLMPTLFDLRDPNRFPELYRVENRFDRSHLSEGGAGLFSRIFAKHLVTHLDDEPSDEEPGTSDNDPGPLDRNSGS